LKETAGRFPQDIAAAATVLSSSGDSDAGGGLDWAAELLSIAAGAQAARHALTGCYEELPAKLAASRRGAPELVPV